jgi:hypothetical protein
MGVSSLDLRAVCDTIVALARRSVEQRRELEAHAERIAMLESAIVESGEEPDPPPLEIRPSEPTTAEELTRSFENRLAARPEDDD